MSAAVLYANSIVCIRCCDPLYSCSIELVLIQVPVYIVKRLNECESPNVSANCNIMLFQTKNRIAFKDVGTLPWSPSGCTSHICPPAAVFQYNWAAVPPWDRFHVFEPVCTNPVQSSVLFCKKGAVHKSNALVRNQGKDYHPLQCKLKKRKRSLIIIL